MTDYYTFDKKFQVGSAEIGIDTRAGYGYFEHTTDPDGYCGGLWFERNKLIDYDGAFELPEEVITGLREDGFIVDEEFE